MHVIRMVVQFFFFSSRRRHTRSVSAFLLNRSSDLRLLQTHHERQKQPYGRQHTYHHYRTQRPAYEKTERSEERFSRNAETDLVCRLLLEKKKSRRSGARPSPPHPDPWIGDGIQRVGAQIAQHHT